MLRQIPWHIYLYYLITITNSLILTLNRAIFPSLDSLARKRYIVIGKAVVALEMDLRAAAPSHTIRNPLEVRRPESRWS